MIYFAQAGTSGLIKIGLSKNPRNRLAGLGTMSPEPVRLLGVMLGERADEVALHTRFSSCRVRGEWFSAAPELLAFIVEHAKPLEAPPPKVKKIRGTIPLVQRRLVVGEVERRLRDDLTDINPKKAYAAAVSRGVWRAMQRHSSLPYDDLRRKAHVEVAHDLLRQLRIEADIAQYEPPPPPRFDHIPDFMARKPGRDVIEAMKASGQFKRPAPTQLSFEEAE